MVIVFSVPLPRSPSLLSNFTGKSFGVKLLPFFFFLSVVAALISHWLTHKTLCVFTAGGNKENPFQAHQPGDLAGAQNPQPDWRVVSLLILQAPIGMGSVCDACEMQARGRLGLAVSILTLQAIFWLHAGSLFNPASLVGEFGLMTVFNPFHSPEEAASKGVFSSLWKFPGMGFCLSRSQALPFGQKMSS